MDNTGTRNYEMMLILSSEMGEDERNKELDDIKKILAKNSATILNEDVWGIRDLAYRIKKEDQGFYIVFKLEFPNGESLKDINKLLILNQMVLRHMFTACAKNYEFNTAAEYEEAAEKAALEAEREAAEKEEKRRPGKKVEKVEKKKVEPKKVVKKEEKVEEKEEKEEKVEEKKEEIAEETKEESAAKEEEAKKEEKTKLDEVDEKLKSLIDDPDISL